MKSSQKLLFDFAKNFSQDLNEIYQLEQIEFQWPWTYDAWRNLNDSYYICCIYEDKTLVGLALWEKSIWDEVAHLHKILVKKEFQGQGLALEIMNQSVSYLGALGAKSLYLEVAVNNQRAIRFYDKFGFLNLTTKKGFYSDGTDAFAMHKQLN